MTPKIVRAAGLMLGLSLAACNRPHATTQAHAPVANPNPVPVAAPPQWMVVRTIDETTFVITTPTQKVGDLRRVWLAGVPLRGRRYTTTLYEFDCAQDRARTLQENAFAEDGHATRVEAIKDLQWLYPDPDLLIYHLLSHACGRAILAGGKFASIKTLLDSHEALRTGVSPAEPKAEP